MSGGFSRASKVLFAAGAAALFLAWLALHERAVVPPPTPPDSPVESTRRPPVPEGVSITPARPPPSPADVEARARTARSVAAVPGIARRPDAASPCAALEGAWLSADGAQLVLNARGRAAWTPGAGVPMAQITWLCMHDGTAQAMLPGGPMRLSASATGEIEAADARGTKFELRRPH